MNDALVRARADETIRVAAAAWRRAGLVDERSSEEIRSLSPDDRVRRTRPWQLLFFFLTCVLAFAFVGFVAITTRNEQAVGTLFLVFGALAVAATEYQFSALRFDGVGSEAATSFLAISFLSIGFALELTSARVGSQTTIVLSLLFVSAASSAVAWRWGYLAYALAGSSAFLWTILTQTGSRPLIALTAMALFAVAETFRQRRILPLSHRQSLGAVSAVGLAAIYASINLFSLDRRLIEQLRSIPQVEPAPPTQLWRVLAALATAILPLLLLAAGLRLRRRLLLDAGLISGALSLITLRQYVHLGPTWLVLCESGIALGVVALLLERRLRLAPDREIRGFSADRIDSEAGSPSAVEIAGALASLAPEAQAPRASGPEGGGRFGGGGASSDF